MEHNRLQRLQHGSMGRACSRACACFITPSPAQNLALSHEPACSMQACAAHASWAMPKPCIVNASWAIQAGPCISHASWAMQAGPYELGHASAYRSGMRAGPCLCQPPAPAHTNLMPRGTVHRPDCRRLVGMRETITHRHTHMRAHTNTHKHTHMRAHTHTHTTHTHTHTHTETHTSSLAQLPRS